MFITRTYKYWFEFSETICVSSNRMWKKVYRSVQFEKTREESLRAADSIAFVNAR